jgi:hypothetical protein
MHVLPTAREYMFQRCCLHHIHAHTTGELQLTTIRKASENAAIFLTNRTSEKVGT